MGDVVFPWDPVTTTELCHFYEVSWPPRCMSCPPPGPAPAHPAVVLHVLQLALLADAKVQEVLPLQLQGLLVGLGAAVQSPQTTPQPGPSTCPPTWLARLTAPAGLGPVSPASPGSSLTRVPEAAGNVQPSHLDGPHGRMPELHHALPIILQLVHALLLAQQLVLLEVLGEDRGGGAGGEDQAGLAPPHPAPTRPR